ncbi:MAG: hypothetical protein Q3971_00590 [Moraxella sp.]|nr:hypothetical protein [Moraxella sp.]
MSDEFVQSVKNSVKYTITPQGDVQTLHTEKDFGQSNTVSMTFKLVQERGVWKIDEVIRQNELFKKDLDACLKK